MSDYLKSVLRESGVLDDEKKKSALGYLDQTLIDTGLKEDPNMPKSDMGKEFAAGWANYKAGMQHIGAALGSDTAAEWAAENEKKANRYQAASNAPHTWDEVKFGDKDKGILPYLGQLAAGSAPFIGEQAAFVAGDVLTGGALTPVHATRLGTLAGSVATKMGAKSAAEAAISKGVKGVVVGTERAYPSSFGTLLKEQHEESGEYDIGSAAGMAAPYAALSGGLGIEGAVARGGLRVSGIQNRAARGLLTGTVTGVEESIGEAGQAFLENVARKTVNPGYDLLGEQALSNIKESAIGGFALGKAVGTTGGLLTKNPSALPVGNEQSGISQAVNNASGYTATFRTPEEIKQAAAPMVVTPGGEVLATPEQQQAYDQFGRNMTPNQMGQQVANANAQASQQQAAQQQQAQAEQVAADRETTLKRYGGVTPVEGSEGWYTFNGKNYSTEELQKAIDKFTVEEKAKAPHIIQAEDAIISAWNNQHSDQQINAYDMRKTKFNRWFKDASSIDTVVNRIKAEIKRLETKKGDNVVAEVGFYQNVLDNLTGEQNEQVSREQTPTGMGAVPASAEPANALLQPGSVQPVGAGSVAQGPDGQQAIATGAQGAPVVRSEPTADGVAVDNGIPQAEQVNGQTTTTTAAADPSSLAAGQEIIDEAATGENAQPEKTLAQEVIDEVLSLVIVRAGRMKSEDVVKKRDFIALTFGTKNQNTLDDLMAHHGITVDQAKKWSKEASTFVQDNAAKIAAALGTVAAKRNMTLAEVQGLVGGHVSEKSEAAIETSESKLDERDLGNEDSGIATLEGRTGASIQEVDNKNETVNAKFVRLADMLEKEKKKKNPDPAKVAKLQADFDAHVEKSTWDAQAKKFGLPEYAKLPDSAKADWVRAVKDNKTSLAAMNKIYEANKLQFTRSATVQKKTWMSDDLRKSLKKFLATGSNFDSRVMIVDSIDELPAGIQAQLRQQNAENAPAFVDVNRVYMIAPNITKGTEISILMHELGAHLGMENLLGTDNYNQLVNQIAEWIDGKGNALEVEIAQRARDRVANHERSVPLDQTGRRNELLAYFVEEAILAGAKPQSMSQSKGIVKFLRSVVAALKAGLRKIGMNKFDELTVQNIIDMAYGAAKLELDGTYHGTDASFRKFMDMKIDRGVNGWGHYTAQAVKEAREYGKKLMRTLPLANTNELIDYYTELKDQPKILATIKKNMSPEVAKLMGPLEELTGQVFSRRLEKIEAATGMLYSALPQKVQDSVIEVGEIASKYMEYGLKIPGMVYPAARAFDTNNIVMFSGQNVARISTRTEDSDLQFSIPVAAQVKALANKNIHELPKALRGPVRNIWDALFSAKETTLGVLITEDVAELAKKYMPSITKYISAQHERNHIANMQEEELSKIMVAFDKLPANIRTAVNELIAESTVKQKWAYDPGIDGVTPDFELSMKLKAMPAEAQQVVRKVFEHGRTTLKMKQEAIREVIEQVHGDNETKKEEMLRSFATVLNLDPVNPYAPLKRFGSFVVVAKSQAYLDAEANKDNAKIEELQQSEKDYVVEFAETMGEAKELYQQMAATGDYASLDAFKKSQIKDKLYSGVDLWKGFAKLKKIIAAERSNDESEISAKLEQMVNELYLVSLADSSARKSEMQRKNIAGFNRDMMRSFFTQGMADAHYIANLKTSDKSLDALVDMQKEAALDREHANPYLNEMLAREAQSLEIRDPSMWDAANRLTGNWFLTFSPAFYLQQSTQSYMLSLPYLAGKYAYFRSARALQAAYKDVLPLVKGTDLKEHLDFSKMPEDVRDMLNTLVGRGRINIGIEAEISQYRTESGNAAGKAYQSATDKLRGVINRIEAVNRASAAIAAYRLEMQKSGDKVKAVDAADKVVHLTHGSYDGFNTPRHFNSSGFMRSVTQFRRFQVIQLSMLARLAHQAFKGASPTEKAVARKQFGFLLTHTFIMGGVKGLPIYGLLSLGYSLLKWAFGDEDDPADLETVLRDNGGLFLARGIPAALGVDLSGKLGLGNTMSLLPYTEFDITSRAGVEKQMIGLLGPFMGGLLPKMGDSVGQVMQGNYYKGLEGMLPVGVGNAMKALRFADEGVTMRNGDVVIRPEEVGFTDMVFQGLGIPTSQLSERTYRQSELKRFEDFYDQRTSDIKRRYNEAYKNGDSATLAELREDWSTLQQSRVKYGFKRQPISELLKSPMEQRKRERKTTGGIQYTDSNKAFVQRMGQ